jgi:nucleoside-diphosphate-sugar epimerase
MNKNILITGGSGFLGSHVIKLLIKRQDLNLICLKRSFSDLSRLKNIDLNKIFFYNIDLIDLEEIFSNHKIDVIIHMATEYGRGDAGVSKILETNLIFPIKIVELAIKYHVKAFLNTDSYFNKSNKSYNYLLNYSLSKKVLLTWLDRFSDKINVVNIILEHVFGELDNNYKFIEFATQKIAVENVCSFDMTYGNQKRDFIYVEDVACAFEKILDFTLAHDFNFKSFEIGLGKSIEIKEMIEMIKKISKSNTNIIYGSLPYRSDEIMDSVANTHDLNEIGWLPKFNVESGLIKMLEYYGFKN